ncbi:branched-chain amino acid ABC transporter permease [Dechloromonas sp. HYN0024]|uniref:branched-chain amino acid ABC transporter permease n=1 Tax=Dechloromonas sp. HYN0024 TaxID=2231055 RepID=UPI000E4520CB|nr:branched-chain amino acid ABC transporter permease [Dechloromonas sp. HYN0024]AXS81228.1 branched-chain amino acid ABC transporter permease [Dechloromonas sp. HYN0024]
MTQLFLEQALNGLQFGLMLFLLAAGLTLVFGIMDCINLAHGSLYMVGAYFVAAATQAADSFWIGLATGVAGAAVLGLLLELSLFRRLYKRDHLSQVLATFALILIANEAVRVIWGAQPVMLNPPESLSGPVVISLFGDEYFYPAYRLVIIAFGLGVAGMLYLLVAKSRLGMWVRAGASNREMTEALGINVQGLFTAVFVFGAALCALAGGLLGPLLAVQVGMGESVLILAFVVIIIGGIGSIRGALVGSLIVGSVDTLGRALLPTLLRVLLPADAASTLGPALASILIYLLMAGILFFRPQGLFPARA